MHHIPHSGSGSGSGSGSTDQIRTASVSVDVGDSLEQVSATLEHPDSVLVTADLAFPLGIVFEG